MQAIKYLLLVLILTDATPELKAQSGGDYLEYHFDIIQAEKLITEEKFKEALNVLDKTFNDYDFVFLRDYKVATQLAIVVEDNTKAIEYLKLAIQGGWTKKEISKNKLIRPLINSISKSDYESLRRDHYQNTNDSLRLEIHELYKMDQKMAIKALFKIGQKSKVRYAEKKFAPHSKNQINKLNQIITRLGYPGEQLIGNDIWVSTILSHHNSISADFNKSDTLYNYLKPKLFYAIKTGQMSPFEYALIENWKIVSESDHSISSYGYLGPELNEKRLTHANDLRHQIGLRSIETRNALVDIQIKTGIDFYLSGNPWQDGKISIHDETN